jgi:hypothetical protein
MRPSIFLSGATAALLFARAGSAQTAHTRLTEEQYLTLGKQYTGWLFNGRADSLLANATPQAQQGSGGVDGILQQRDRLASRAGNETMVLVEKMTWRRGMPQFWHEAMFDHFEEPLVVRWVMDDKGAIIGMGLGPKSSTPAVDSLPPKD